MCRHFTLKKTTRGQTWAATFRGRKAETVEVDLIEKRVGAALSLVLCSQPSNELPSSSSSFNRGVGQVRRHRSSRTIASFLSTGEGFGAFD
jgi:hypothetical protein